MFLGATAISRIFVCFRGLSEDEWVVNEKCLQARMRSASKHLLLLLILVQEYTLQVRQIRVDICQGKGFNQRLYCLRFRDVIEMSVPVLSSEL